MLEVGQEVEGLSGRQGFRVGGYAMQCMCWLGAVCWWLTSGFGQMLRRTPTAVGNT